MEDVHEVGSIHQARKVDGFAGMLLGINLNFHQRGLAIVFEFDQDSAFFTLR